MRNFILLFFLFSFCSLFAQKELISFEIGQTPVLSGFELQDIDGTYKKLETLSGENGLLIVFSCNTCPFVIGGGDFPGWEKDYSSLYKAAEEARVKMILVNSNEAKRTAGDGFEDMVNRAKEKGYLFPYLYDKNSELADYFGASTTPHLFLLDKSGKLIYKGGIDNTWDPKRKADEQYIIPVLDAVKKSKKLPYTSTQNRGCSIKRVAH